jgi:hypothetical protein
MMQMIEVYIQNVVVYQEEAEESVSMMRAHVLRKKFCIDILQKNEVQAGVYVLRDSGYVEARNIKFKDGYMVIESGLNKPEFIEEPEWYDDIIEHHEKLKGTER